MGICRCIGTHAICILPCEVCTCNPRLDMLLRPSISASFFFCCGSAYSPARTRGTVWAYLSHDRDCLSLPFAWHGLVEAIKYLLPFLRHAQPLSFGFLLSCLHWCRHVSDHLSWHAYLQLLTLRQQALAGLNLTHSRPAILILHNIASSGDIALISSGEIKVAGRGCV